MQGKYRSCILLFCFLLLCAGRRVVRRMTYKQSGTKFFLGLVKDEQLLPLCIACVWSGGCRPLLCHDVFFSVWMNLMSVYVCVSTEDIIMQLGHVCSERGCRCSRRRALSFSQHRYKKRFTSLLRMEELPVFSLIVHAICRLNLKLHLHATLRQRIGKTLPDHLQSYVFVGVPCVKSSPPLPRWVWGSGATLASPQGVTSVLMALILSGDRASQVLGRSSLSVRLSNSFSCKYLKLNSLYTCIVIATFPWLLINFVPNASL